jgi:hypothetical protein
MHFPCGATFQFQGRMTIYCAHHRVRQNVEGLPSPPNAEYVICFDEVVATDVAWRWVLAPCCSRHLHQDCVQRLTCRSGLQHFKCPNCNNKDVIVKEFKKLGS